MEQLLCDVRQASIIESDESLAEYSGMAEPSNPVDRATLIPLVRARHSGFESHKNGTAHMSWTVPYFGLLFLHFGIILSQRISFEINLV